MKAERGRWHLSRAHTVPASLTRSSAGRAHVTQVVRGKSACRLALRPCQAAPPEVTALSPAGRIPFQAPFSFAIEAFNCSNRRFQFWALFCVAAGLVLLPFRLGPPLATFLASLHWTRCDPVWLHCLLRDPSPSSREAAFAVPALGSDVFDVRVYGKLPSAPSRANALQAASAKRPHKNSSAFLMWSVVDLNKKREDPR